MVWNSTQSALYKAVNAHNGGGDERQNTAPKKVRKNAQKTPDFSRGNNVKNHSENRSGNFMQNECRCCPNNAPNDPISRIMSDRDMLLIAGLIFILWRENADRKLIMALAIVLLG